MTSPDGSPRHLDPSVHLLLRASDRIVAPSAALLEIAGSCLPGLEPRGAVIHNGIDFAELHEAPVERAGPYLLCVAHLNHNKGLDVLLTAFHQIARNRANLDLIIAGDGPLRASIEARIEELDLRQRVTVTGWKSRREIGALLRGCEVFVLPSRSESFGLAIVEALACRRPVIASRVGGIPEIIQDGETGILVEPENPDNLARAVERLLDNHEVRVAIAEEGHQMARRRFQWEYVGRDYEETFSELLGA